MKKLLLTGLGNEIDISTGATVFTAIFNGGELRITLSEDATKQLTQFLYSSGSSGGMVELEDRADGEPEEHVAQGGFDLEDVPPSAYDNQTSTDEDGIGSI